MVPIYSKTSSRNHHLTKGGLLSIKILRMSETDHILTNNLIYFHNLLCDVVICIEDFFGFSIVTFNIVHFFNVVIYSYYLLEIWFDPEQFFQTWNDYGLVCVILSQLMFANTRLAAFIEICNKTVQQNQKINTNIHKLLNLNIEPKMREQLNIFADQLENRKVDFSAAGIFKLDRSFYLMVRIYF